MENQISAKIPGPGRGGDKESIQAEQGMSNDRDFFKIKNEVVYGIGKLSDLLSGVAQSTQAAYQAAWAQWAHFTALHPAGAWVEKHEPKWDGWMIDWILLEARILGLQACTERGKGDAVRYWGILSGFLKMDWQIQASVE